MPLFESMSRSDIVRRKSHDVPKQRWVNKEKRFAKNLKKNKSCPKYSKLMMFYLRCFVTFFMAAVVLKLLVSSITSKVQFFVPIRRLTKTRSW